MDVDAASATARSFPRSAPPASCRRLHPALLLGTRSTEDTRRAAVQIKGARLADLGVGDGAIFGDGVDDVLAEISRFLTGDVVKMTGDGVLALLPSATAAVHAARRLRERLVGDHLGVRIGIHVGEIDRRGDDVSGLAVNIAARVMAQAEAGQIVTSAIVTELTDCVGFAPAGSHRLKGVEGEWPLYVVEGRGTEPGAAAAVDAWTRDSLPNLARPDEDGTAVDVDRPGKPQRWVRTRGSSSDMLGWWEAVLSRRYWI